MKRREFIAGLGSAAWPLAARAQQATIPVIGYVSTLTQDADRRTRAAYRRGLGEQGYVEGRNVEILYRYREGEEWEPDRMSSVIEDLVHHRVAAIYVEGGPPFVRSAKAATATIPIVFVNGTDPVASGIVASLNRPGGNVTGIYFRAQELTAKRLELMHEVVPAVTSIGFLSGAASGPQEAEAAARILGVRLTILEARTASAIESAFTKFAERRIGALLVGFNVQAPQIVALAARYRLPAIYAARDAIEAGGLMSYGASVADATRIAGIYTGRILKGEKPADLPVQQSTKFEFVINLKTAKALGLTIPETLLATADEVIE
jgi:putative tryptophan/tyrosine transport system substrate-binding protein